MSFADMSTAIREPAGSLLVRVALHFAKEDGASDSLAQSGDIGRRLDEAFGDHRLHVRSGEGLLADEHLEEDATRRVDVAAAIDRVARCLFRARVRRRADAHPRPHENAGVP